MTETKILDEIKDMVNAELSVDILQKNRKQEVVYARALFCRLAYLNTHHSFSSIGQYIGRNHATVLHAVRNIFPMFEKQSTMFKMYLEAHDKIRKTIYNIDPDKKRSLAETLFDEKMSMLKTVRDVKKELNDLKEKHNRMLKYYTKFEENALEKYGV